jgi:hypothetical protein
MLALKDVICRSFRDLYHCVDGKMQATTQGVVRPRIGIYLLVYSIS